MDERFAATPALTNVRAEPFRQSWVDALHEWIERRPWPTWVTYVAAWIALAGTHTTLKWIEGTYPVGTFFPFHLLVHASGVYVLALLQHLDRVAANAVDTMRPVLELDDEAVAQVRRRLSTMPARTTLSIFVFGVALGLVQRMALVAPDMAKYKYASSGPVYVFEMVTIPMFVFPLIIVLFFHGFRQLRLIDQILRRHVRIDLFQTRPLFAFSRLAARNAVGLLVIGYAWIAMYPRGVDESVWTLVFAMEAVLVALVVLAFIWPLWGVHLRLLEERVRRRSESYVALDRVVQAMHEEIHAGNFMVMDGLTKAVTGLTEELRIIQGASTWPWSPTTLRAFLTAVLLPMFLWATQQVLSRTLLA